MKKYLIGFAIAIAVTPLASLGAGEPSLSVVSNPISLQVGEMGTWQVRINYPTNNLATSSFYAEWGDEQTHLSQSGYVGPNNTSGADDAAKFFHAYKTAGTYHPTFTVFNQYNQSAQISTDVSVGTEFPSAVFVVPELGIQFPIPSDLSDLVYVLRDREDAVFSSKTLMQADQDTGGHYCTADQGPLGTIHVDALHQISYRHAQDGCSAYSSVTDTQTRLSSLLKQAVLSATFIAPTYGEIPPAGYEDTVLTNIDAYKNPFPDTDISQIWGKAAAELYRRAVIGGFPDGEFKGAKKVNRAEAAKFLLLARFGSVADASNNGHFPDVLDNQWYTKFVVTAANRGIINGYPDGTFKPADQVNTAEFLKMLSLTFGLQLNMPYVYTDVSSNDWFAPYAGIAQKYHLFPYHDSPRILTPEASLSRAEVAVAIYEYLSNR